MPQKALEECCLALAKALPPTMEVAADRLQRAETDAAAQLALTTVERLLKVAKTAAESMEKADPEGSTVTLHQMREVTRVMTEHVHRIADRSPYAAQIRAVLS